MISFIKSNNLSVGCGRPHQTRRKQDTAGSKATAAAMTRPRAFLPDTSGTSELNAWLSSCLVRRVSTPRLSGPLAIFVAQVDQMSRSRLKLGIGSG